jgi:peptidoglycan-N-acetylglucosamine deacetylase
MICPLAPAHFVALGAFEIFIALLFLKPTLAPLPLIVFVVVCCIAPFLPRLSFFLPIVSRGRKGANGVALTFDDGPDPETTPKLLELLARHKISATFFVTGRRAERYPELIRAIIAGGHTVGNHSYNHSPFLMLKGSATLRREVSEAQQVFARFGIVPLAFRPPVGICNPSLWRVLLENGMFCVNFTLRARDMGNRRVAGLARKLLAKVAARDIVLLHDVAPRQGDAALLIGEFESLIEGIRKKGLEIVPLATLIEKEVMQRGDLTERHVAELFYDSLAAAYDEEQFCSSVSLSRTTEQRLFAARIPELFSGAGRVLEVGAGTGIFTLEIARNCNEVVAADISANMLAVLEKKAQAKGISNIRALKGNVETVELPGPFSVVCAFLSLEYLSDLGAFLKKLADQVEPGGRVYFITARSSFFRFWTQVGNAMRQGLWLKAHTRREIESMLKEAGFEEISIAPHLLRCIISGGMLLEVKARRSGIAPVAAEA